MGALPAPPSPTPGGVAAARPTADSSHLQLRRSELTVFTDDADPATGRSDRLTISLSRAGDAKLVTLDAPTMACGGSGLDPAADAFDDP